MKKFLYLLILAVTLASGLTVFTQTSRQVPAGSVVSISSGGLAANSFAVGAIRNGADVAIGSTLDARCTTYDASACTANAGIKNIAYQLSLINAAAATDTCDGLVPTTKRYISANTAADKSQVKATAGALCHIEASNANASANAWLKCTNLTSANTTVGSSAVFYDMIIPFGLTSVDTPHIPFSVALTCYLVTGKTDADTTAVAADDIHYVLTYQ